MHWTLSVVVFVLLVHTMDSKPVAQKRGPPSQDGKTVEGDSENDQGTNLPYDHYLREVVSALEEDPEFRKKLEESNVSDIKDGSIAKHIEWVSHNIRTKLDEIKRREIYRLQELRRLQMKSMQGVGRIDVPSHIDVANPHSFEMKDLEHLIKQTTDDLEKLDEQRKKEFKEYEMEKEYEKRDKLSHMNEEEKKKEMAHIEEMKKKHNDHPKIHHPGSKDQFEEVWEKKDHLEDQEFNPKTFFNLHDNEGDGFWGIQEVEAVLNSELDKVYDPDNEEDDQNERFEEMNRMREHIFGEMDKDNDKRISKDEFLSYTGQDGENKEFKKDDGWKTIDEEDMFTDDEYNQFVQEHHAQPGEIPPPMDPNVAHMQQQGGQYPPGQGEGHNLQYDPNAHTQQAVQQQQQFAQQQQMLEHQQQQFVHQQAAQQQLAQQHAQIQQQHMQQQQQHLQQQQQHMQQQQPQMGQPVHQQGQVPVQQQAQVPVQQQQGQGQVPVQQQGQGQGQVPVHQQQVQGQVPAQQQGQVPVQHQQAQAAQGQQQQQQQQAHPGQ